MKFTLLILFTFFSVVTFSQESVENNVELPGIKLDRLDYDFGEIQQGEILSHAFTITNTGSSPLIISDVHTQCGCTAVQYPKEPIMPGKTDRLVIQYDSSGKLGIQRKVVTIQSNAESEVKVRIKAQVFILED